MANDLTVLGALAQSPVALKIDRWKAKELYRAYLTHQHYERPVDEEIRRAYRLIAQGRMIIRALDAVRLAGLGDDGLPKLAIARADQKTQSLMMHRDGSARMTFWRWRGRFPASRTFDWPAGAFSPRQSQFCRQAEAVVPLVPLPLRPKRGLENYFILWEADWSKAVPHDPLLLRRLGKGDLWLVLAQWDLTEVERAALATRVNAA
jgi:hypothetical protein